METIEKNAHRTTDRLFVECVCDLQIHWKRINGNSELWVCSKSLSLSLSLCLSLFWCAFVGEKFSVYLYFIYQLNTCTYMRWASFIRIHRKLSHRLCRSWTHESSFSFFLCVCVCSWVMLKLKSNRVVGSDNRQIERMHLSTMSKHTDCCYCAFNRAHRTRTFASLLSPKLISQSCCAKSFSIFESVYRFSCSLSLSVCCMFDSCAKSKMEQFGWWR